MINPYTTADPRKILKPFTETVVVRTVLCLFTSVVFLIVPSDLYAIVIGLFALPALMVNPFRGALRPAIYIILVTQFIWCVMLGASYAFNLYPVNMTYLRELYFTPENSQIAFLCGVQMLYIAGALVKLPSPEMPTLSDRRWVALAIAGAIAISSIACNQSGTVLEGGYGGADFRSDRWSGWPLVFIASCAFFFATPLGRSRVGLGFILVVVAYWLFHGNRSEVLSLAGYALMLDMVRGGRRVSAVRVGLLGGALVVIYIVFELVAQVRSVGLTNLTELTVFRGILDDDRITVSTVGSSIYSAVAMIGVTGADGLLWGSSYWGQIANSIPSFVPVPWERFEDIAYLLVDASAMGGVGVLGEAYANYGVFGPTIFMALWVMVLGIMMAQAANNKIIAACFVIACALYSSRFFFYGYVYLYKTSLLFASLYIGWAALRHLKVIRGITKLRGF